MAWDSGNNNTWSSTRLNTGTLNGTYLSGLGTWASMIAEHEWKVGGMAWSNSNTAKQYYATELGNSDGNSVTYRAKIGLMYVSDYGYEASPENWNTTLYNYANDTNRNNNWMYLGTDEWTISRNSSVASNVFGVSNSGFVSYSNVTNTNAVRPSFYLTSDTGFVSGDGTQTNPFKIQ